MRFEDRLARTASSLLGLGLLGTLGACTGETVDKGDGTGTPVDLSGMCSGDTPPVDYLVTSGFVTVAPGAPCPDPADAQLEVFGCSFLEWQDITCSLDRTDQNQVFVDDGYGGHFADPATAGTTTGVGTEVVDVCWYQGVFYLPPDHPTCGRPLLQDGEVVLAEVRPGASGWSAGAAPVVHELTDAERREIGEHWLASALLEHASVASFAHFSLDLMGLGAPPELLAAAQQAALDEIGHAKLCFSLASGYRGAPVGPGALGARPAPGRTREEVADALVREGCVGETLAAIDAAARLAVATDPAVRAALQVIFRDESAHAALAWRTLAWMLEQDPTLRERVDRVFAEERLRWSRLAEGPATVSAGARAHGLLSASARRLALQRGWDEVIAASWPAAREALGDS